MTRSEANISTLYQREAPALIQMLTKRCDRAMAEDVAQEAFLRLMRYAGQDKAKLTRSYLFATARNVLATELLRHRKHGQDLRTDSPKPADAVRPGRIDPGSLPESVRERLASLPKEQFEVLILRSVQGLTWNETGALLKTSPEAARRHHSRGVETLRSGVRVERLSTPSRETPSETRRSVPGRASA